MAKELSQLAGGYLGLELPEEEIGFIAMYLRALANSGSNPQETIGIVIVTHGNVAQGMANVANMLLGVDMVRAVEMSLDESQILPLKGHWKQCQRSIRAKVY